MSRQDDDDNHRLRYRETQKKNTIKCIKSRNENENENRKRKSDRAKEGGEDCKRYTKLCESIERTSQKDTH